MKPIRLLGIFCALSICLSGLFAAEPANTGVADPDPALPKEFAFTLNNGYGGFDDFSADPAVFENLLVNMKKAGFNTIYCVHRGWRVELCRKHGIKMMVDVLAWKPGIETDIRRNEQQRVRVKQICEKSRGDDAVWGYNLWNETLSFFGHPDGKSIDEYVRMLKQWDPTHPVWLGTYRVSDANKPKSKPGVHAYYDYAWQRGFHWHFDDLKWYANYVPSQKGVIGQWEMGSDYHRNSYTLNTSIPFGLKVMIWFIGGPFDAKGNVDPKHRFHHLVRIGQEMAPLYKELGRLGMPAAVYSTPTTKSETNQAKTPGVPWNLQGFPPGHWLRVVEGEVLCGFFRSADGGDAIYVANHNAFADQRVTVVLQGETAKKARLEIFDRAAGEWKKLDSGVFPLCAAGGELLHVPKADGPLVPPPAPRPAAAGRATDRRDRN